MKKNKKAPKLFHKNFTFKKMFISIIFFRRVYMPFNKFKFNNDKIILPDNNTFYNKTLSVMGWDIFSIGWIK